MTSRTFKMMIMQSISRKMKMIPFATKMIHSTTLNRSRIFRGTWSCHSLVALIYMMTLMRVKEN